MKAKHITVLISVMFFTMFECKNTSNKCAKIKNQKRKQPKYQVDYDDLFCSVQNNPDKKES